VSQQIFRFEIIEIGWSRYYDIRANKAGCDSTWKLFMLQLSRLTDLATPGKKVFNPPAADSIPLM